MNLVFFLKAVLMIVKRRSLSMASSHRSPPLCLRQFGATLFVGIAWHKRVYLAEQHIPANTLWRG